MTRAYQYCGEVCSVDEALLHNINPQTMNLCSRFLPGSVGDFDTDSPSKIQLDPSHLLPKQSPSSFRLPLRVELCCDCNNDLIGRRARRNRRETTSYPPAVGTNTERVNWGETSASGRSRLAEATGIVAHSLPAPRAPCGRNERCGTHRLLLCHHHHLFLSFNLWQRDPRDCTG